MSVIFSSSGNGGSPASTYLEKPADAAWQVSDLIARRWSLRAFDESRPVMREQILVLLEATRRVPSNFNEQPWRYLVFDGGDPEALRAARACLIGFNAWGLKARLLLSLDQEHLQREQQAQPLRAARLRPRQLEPRAQSRQVGFVVLRWVGSTPTRRAATSASPRTTRRWR